MAVLDPSQDQWSNYSTPEQLQAQRDYANALLYGKGQQNVASPWQGASNMINALLGGNRLYNTGQFGARQNQQGAQDVSQTRLPGVGAEPNQQGGPLMGGPQGGPPIQSQGPQASGSAASVRNNNPGAQWPGSVASQFGATGSENVAGGNKIATFDDPVKGAAAEMALLDKNYSGMPLGAAISKWSGGNSGAAYAAHIAKDTGLTPDTVISPQLLRGPQGVALAKSMANWEAGGQYPLSDQQWEQAHQLAFGQPQASQQPANGPALAFNGQPSGPGGNAPDAPSAIASALAPRSPTTPATPLPPGSAAQPVAPTQGSPQGQPVPPSTLPQRLPVGQGQISRILANPMVSPEIKNRMLDLYQAQGQPVQAPGTGGTWVVGNDGTQRFVPTLNQGSFEGAGSKFPLQSVTVPDGHGGYIQQQVPFVGNGDGQPGPSPSNAPNLNSVDIRRGAGGGAAPAPEAQPEGLPKPPATPPSLKDFGSRPELPGPDEGPLATPPPGTQGMNATPASNPLAYSEEQPIPAKAAVASAGMPVGASGAQETPTSMLASGPPSGTGIKTAQNLPFGLAVDNMANYANQLNANKEGMAEGAKKQVESFQNKYDSIQSAGQAARQGYSALQQAYELTKDPRFYSGLFSNGVLDAAKVASWVGRDPNAAGPMEFFQKLTAGNIIGDMRSSFGGLGQIRLAEINLLAKANGNLDNTPAGNRAVLNVLMRAHDQADKVAQLANMYAQGTRWDDNGNSYSVGKNTGLDYGWDKTLQKWTDTHPLFTDSELKSYGKHFDTPGVTDPQRVQAGAKQIQGIVNGAPQEAGKPAGSATPTPPPGYTILNRGGPPAPAHAPNSRD